MESIKVKVVIAVLFSILLSGCGGTPDGSELETPINPGIVTKPAIPFLPRQYICYVGDSINIDGILNERSWQALEWSSEFNDIEGTIRPKPLHSTKVKLLWDENYLYVAAEITEPHIWAYLSMRDTVIFYDNDFEIFIDPDDDTHGYYELEINAANTVWDLLLTRPYRDKGRVIDSWDISGLKSAVKVYGTINNPNDRDDRWVSELAIPLSVLTEWGIMPNDSVNWRINFSRVNWQTDIVDGRYIKKTDKETGKNLPEYNWTWAPQGVINMHYPEMWGYLQFSTIKAGEGVAPLLIDPDSRIKWSLRTLYYAQRIFATRSGHYTADLTELNKIGFETTGNDPDIILTFTGYQASLPSVTTGKLLIIDETGKVSYGTKNITLTGAEER